MSAQPEYVGELPTRLKLGWACGGLGTARVVTTNLDGDVRVNMVCLKVPAGGNPIDNFQSGQSGNLIAKIDIDTGRVLKCFGSSPERPWLIREVESHPDSGQLLEGFQVPCWEELMETVKRGARAFNEFGTIGWDIGLTEDGPSIIEGNARYGPDPHQVVLERGLKREFECLLA